MRRMVTFAVLAMATTLAPAEAQMRDGRRAMQLRPFVDPSGVIAAEVALNQLAQDKGQWTAWRQTAAEEAVLFAPSRVLARTWLKGRAGPQIATRHQPFAVWMSCDGGYAVTRGAWQRGDAEGVFFTVWQRQARGGYKWVLALDDVRPTPLDPPDMIAGKVAPCPPGGAAGSFRSGPEQKGKVVPLADPAAAQSEDATLRWRATIDAQGAGTFMVESRGAAGYERVASDTFAVRG